MFCKYVGDCFCIPFQGILNCKLNMLFCLQGCKVFKVFFMCFMQVCIDNINREYSGIDSHTYQWQDLMNTLNKNCELDYLEPDVWHVDDHAEYVFNIDGHYFSDFF